MSDFSIFTTYRDLKLQIELVKEQILLTENNLKYWFGIRTNGKGVPFGSWGVHKFGANTGLMQADKTIGSLNQLNERLEQLEQAKNRIEGLLSQFDSLEYKIAYGRYIEGKTLREIADELDKSYDYIREVMSRMKKRLEPTTNPQTS